MSNAGGWNWNMLPNKLALRVKLGVIQNSTLNMTVPCFDDNQIDSKCNAKPTNRMEPAKTWCWKLIKQVNHYVQRKIIKWRKNVSRFSLEARMD